MELFNAVSRGNTDTETGRALQREAVESMLLLLAPIVPHVAQVLWEALGRDGLIMDASWPTPDESALTRDTIELVVQVNGKLRARIDVDADASKDNIEATALAHENVVRFIEGKSVRKVVVVPGRLVNVVV